MLSVELVFRNRDKLITNQVDSYPKYSTNLRVGTGTIGPPLITQGWALAGYVQLLPEIVKSGAGIIREPKIVWV